MKILYISSLFPQQRVVKFVGTLMKEGHEVTILSFDLDRKKADMFKNIDSNNLKIISLNLKGKFKLLPFKNLIFFKTIRKLNKDKYDTIIFRDIFTYKIAKTLRKPYKSQLIMDLADNYPEVIINRFTPVLIKKISYFILDRLEKKAVKNSSVVFTVTEDSKDLIVNKHNVSNQKIKVLKNYPLKEDISSDDKVTKNLRNGKIAYVGTVDEKVRNLSEVFNFLKSSNHIIHIYSLDKKLVSKLIEDNNASSVAFYKEPVSRKELVNVLKNYSIGIIPHREIEGTKYTIPNKLYDYIHSNLPVLASNNTAMATEIRNLGIGEIYVSREDFHKKVSYLLKNSDEYFVNLECARKNCIWEKQQITLLEAIKK